MLEVCSICPLDSVSVLSRVTDIKLVIAMHDRYSLGCWGRDAYVSKYNLPTTNCQNGVPDSSIFYTNQNAITDVRSLHSPLTPHSEVSA